MADGTGIEWTDATWNVVTGCSVVSPGCTHCYAMRLAGTRLRRHPTRRGLTRDTKAGPVWTGEVRFNERWLDAPLRWQRPRRVFVCAHGDLFHEAVPDAVIDRVFAVMALAPQHSFQVLTKRAARMRAYLSDESELGERLCRAAWHLLGADAGPAPDWPLPNVWLGVSVEDQVRADQRIPDLLATPAAVRFLSCEPLLGPVDLEAAWHSESALDLECWGECGWCGSGRPPLHNCHRVRASLYAGRTRSGLDWVIAGGESGPGARPMHPDWVRTLRDQCAETGTAFFFKQWGDWLPWEPAPAPYWQSQAGGVQDRHVLFPGDMDGDANWDDGLWAIDDSETGHAAFQRVGKKQAGFMLDGRAWRQFPTEQTEAV